MSTELAANGSAIDPRVLEQVVVGGDLARLNPADRLKWYQARCDAAGLDPRTQPFQYITLQGKLTLYATKTATDQLIASRRLTVEIVDRRHDKDAGIFEVQCRVKFSDGHHVEDFAALNVYGLKGDALCNALMKCVTKAKRRTVLSACGLGMLDETEVETIPDAVKLEAEGSHHAKHHLNGTGYGSGAYAPPKVVAAYEQWLVDFVATRNAEWLDTQTGKYGEIPKGMTELTNTHQLGGHLFKVGRDTKEFVAPDEPRGTQRNKFAAIWWDKCKGDVENEARAYCRMLWNAAARKLKQAAIDAEPQAEDENQDIESAVKASADWTEVEADDAYEGEGVAEAGR